MTDPHTSLPVFVRRNDESGLYELGVVIEGAPIVFAVRKTGGVDQDIERARAAAPSPPAADELAPGYTPPAA